MHDLSGQSIARIDRARRDLIRPNRHRQVAPVSVAAWDVPDEPVSFDHARQQQFADFPAGTSWGRTLRPRTPPCRSRTWTCTSRSAACW